MSSSSSTVAASGGADIHAAARFLLRHHSAALRAVLLSPDPIHHYSITISFADLLDSAPALAHILFSRPADLLPALDAAARLAQGVILNDDDESHPGASAKEFVHVRVDVGGSPLEFSDTFPSIGRVRVRHRGLLLTLKGTVIRSGAIKMIEGERQYQCRKCRQR